MRLVLDTNVLISALIARGISHKVVEHCISHHTPVSAQFIMNELREKLADKFHYELPVADEAVELFRSTYGVN